MARISRKKRNPGASSASMRVWKTALYIRLSVEDNGKDSDSIENQTALLEAYVASHPYLEKKALFVDNGYTGTDFLRPEFARMMEDVQAGRIDCVIVKDLSRLGRNYIETAQFLEKLCPFLGLRFIAVNDHYDSATITNEGQLSASLSNIINDYYAKDISRKITSALRTKMERGDYIGNDAPHGYQKDPGNKNHLIVCPETAPVIQQIFAWRAEGMSYMGINKRLNQAGIVSPGQYRKDHGVQTNRNTPSRRILWNRHMITEILSDIVYIGHLAQRKGSQCLYAGLPYHVTDKEDWIIAENTHEPLISAELFEKVQEINRQAAETAKANAGKYDYLPKAQNIYGSKCTCAKCGRTMKLTRSINREKTKAYFTFKCPTYAEHGVKGCSDVKIKKEVLDEAVFAFIRTQIDVFLDMEQTLRRLLALKNSKLRQCSNMQETTTIERQLEKKRSLLSSAYLDLKGGLLTQEEYGHHRAVITSDIAALELKLAELQPIKMETEKQLTGEMRWRFLAQRFSESKELSADMVEFLVESVQIQEDGSLDIKLRYMDEFASLTAVNERLKKEVAA